MKSNYSFAFSGCGWLTPFHLGAINQLEALGVINEKTLLAGTSGGAIAALIGCSGIDPKVAMDRLIDLSKDNEFLSDIDAGLRSPRMWDLLPLDIVQRCNNRLHVTATRVWPDPGTNVTIFSEFTSPEDLISCVAASCFIPLWSGNRTVVNCRGAMYVDGGVLSITPKIGSVKVSPLPRAIFPKALKPHVYPEKPIPIPKLVKLSFTPAGPDEMHELFAMGENAADKWWKAECTKAGKVDGM
jgi:hypothetical protein